MIAICKRTYFVSALYVYVPANSNGIRIMIVHQYEMSTKLELI